MSITNDPGVYSLGIFLHNITQITVGALGSFTISPGYYIYWFRSWSRRAKSSYEAAYQQKI